MRVVALILLLVVATQATPASADTVQDFDGGGSAYSLGQFDAGPAAAIVGGGPTGNYLRLVSAVNASRNSIGFDLTDKGAFCDVTIDFDFRLTPGTGSADGFSVTLIDTANYDESGAVSVAEEPNLFGSVGIGFDIYENPGDLNDNHVSVHFDGESLVEVDATPVLDLDGTAGNFAHAQILISSDDTGGSVTVTLTPPGGSPTTLVNALAVPALRPYEGRINFGARTGGANADHDLDNVVATYTGCPSVLGSWGAVQPWPVVPIHTHMLPTGQVLFWDRDDALPATQPVGKRRPLFSTTGK